MTDNMKNFLEEASKDREFVEKLNKAETPEAVIALAREKGFALTAEDLKQERAPSGELSDDELEAVAGGKACFCAVGGGGERSGQDDSGHWTDDTCACVAVGAGMGWLRDKNGVYNQKQRCFCTAIGSGTAF